MILASETRNYNWAENVASTMRNILSLLAATCILGCNSATLQNVSVDEYRDLDKCWKRKGSFNALAIMHPDQSGFRAYFVSPYCNIKEEDGEDRHIYRYINLIPLDADNGALKDSGIVDFKIGSTIPTDQSFPVETDRIFRFRGEVKSIDNDGYRYYKISRADIFEDTGATLSTLMRILPKERYKLFEKSN